MIEIDYDGNRMEIVDIFRKGCLGIFCARVLRGCGTFN